MAHLTKRRFLAVAATALGSWLSVAPGAGATRDARPPDLDGFDDDAEEIDYRSGGSGRCAVAWDVEDEDGEERFCSGDSGGYRFVEEDGDEERRWYDENWTLRRVVEEEADGDEHLRTYDGNGVLRYDEREDDDGDRVIERSDGNGVLRSRHRDDADGDDSWSYYDGTGRLIESRRDDRD
jgi:hypothetical protein